MKEKLKRLLDLLKFDIFDNVDDDLILDKKAFKHLYKKIISNITTIISVTSVFIVMITMSFQVFYKINCNEYFGIPKKYFSYDFMELLVELLINFLRIVIFYYITYSCMSISIKVEKRHKKIFKIKTSFCKNILKIIFISITISIFFVCIIITEYLAFYFIFGFNLDTSNLTGIILLILFIIFIIVLLKNKIIFNKTFWILNILLLLILSMYIRFDSVKPKNLKYYEVTVMNIGGKDEQVVVLSNSNDKCFVVKYEEKDGEAIFYTKNYYFINRENRKFNVKIFEYKTIEKNAILK